MTESTRKRIERVVQHYRSEESRCVARACAWQPIEGQRRQLLDRAKEYWMQAERYQNMLDRG